MKFFLILKGLVATNIWQTSEYYQIINENDKVIEKALKVISDKKSYNTILGYTIIPGLNIRDEICCKNSLRT